MKLLHTSDWHVGRAIRGRSRADELIVVSHIYDHAARVRSYEIAAAITQPSARGDGAAPTGQLASETELRS